MPPKRRSSRMSRRPRRNPNEISFIRGHKLVVPNHPTEFCAQPWFSLVVRVRNPTTTITIGELYNSFVSQLTGIAFTGSILNVRLFSIRVWGPIPTTNTALKVSFRDIFEEVVGSTPSGAQNTLEVIENYADQVNRARVGYEYSTAQQQKSLLIGAGITDQLVAITGAGTGSVAYVKLLWRPYTSDVAKAIKDATNKVSAFLIE